MCLKNEKPNWKWDTCSITEDPHDKGTPREDEEPTHDVNSDDCFHVPIILPSSGPHARAPPFVTNGGDQHESVAH